MKRVTLGKAKLRNLSSDFIYSRINYGSTEHDIVVLTKFSSSLNEDFLIKGSWLQQNKRGLNNFDNTELSFSVIEFISNQLYSQKQ